jgi:hypothetical protein
VTGRALVFSNPEIVQLLSRSFIPYAGDKWYLQRQRDEDGEYFLKLSRQRFGGELPKNESRQGIYVSTPEGKLLGSDHFHPDPRRMIALLRDGIEKWKAEPKAALTLAKAPADRQYDRTPPDNGLILNVFTRIPQKPTIGNAWTPNHATGRDHVWLTREETQSLLPKQWRKGERYPVPKAVAERIARFHLVDNVRGEPPMWERDEVRNSAMTLSVADPAAGVLKLSGSADLRSGEERGYTARLQGLLTYDRKKGRFSKFDLLSWGEAWGEGTYTRNAPPGKFPLVVAFSLAGNSPADRVPPQALRSMGDYFSKSRASR